MKQTFEEEEDPFAFADSDTEKGEQTKEAGGGSVTLQSLRKIRERRCATMSYRQKDTPDPAKKLSREMETKAVPVRCRAANRIRNGYWMKSPVMT